MNMLEFKRHTLILKTKFQIIHLLALAKAITKTYRKSKREQVIKGVIAKGHYLRLCRLLGTYTNILSKCTIIFISDDRIDAAEVKQLSINLLKVVNKLKKYKMLNLIKRVDYVDYETIIMSVR